MTPHGSGRGSGPKARALPMVLFGVLTLLTFAGPLAIFAVGRGGDRPTWPPDRPVEWRVFLGVTIGFVLLFLACVIDGVLTLRRLRREAASRPESEPTAGRSGGDS